MGAKISAEEFLEDDIGNKKIKGSVSRIHIHNLKRTKDDILEEQIHSSGIYESTNLYEVEEKAEELGYKLQQLGVFSSIEVYVQKYRYQDGTGGPNPYFEVNFNVKELGRVSAGTHVNVGTNDGSGTMSLKLQNMFGRGEKSAMQYTHGTRQAREFSVNASKFVNLNPDLLLGGSLYRCREEYPWSGYKELDHGVNLNFSFPSLIGNHNIIWEGVWRDLRCISNTTSFAVREQAGHSLKSSLKHIFVRDLRDDALLPKTGTLLKMTQEYAGIGGDSKFFKNEVEFQANKTLFPDLDTVIQLSLSGGIMKNLDHNVTPKINDNFFLGGPLTLRGFNLKGVGPHSDGNSLGGNAYCFGGLHLYSPLPFRPGGLGDIFRSHLFVTAGSCGNVQDLTANSFNKENLLKVANSMRLSYGAGIAFRLGGLARLELNYVIPLWAQAGDSIKPGIQLGVGLTFS